MPLALHKLSLTHFRSYDALRFEPAGAGIVVLTGDNGAGKTNILEAVSLLSPGRGLRGADAADIRNRAAQPGDVWAVSAELQGMDGNLIRIGTGESRDSTRRVVRIDGRDAKTQSALARHVAVVWLTPQMDRIFLDGPSARRRFLDRLVAAFDPDHTARVGRYEKRLRERLSLLTQTSGGPRPDPRWLDALETDIAGDAVSIAAARQNLLQRLDMHVRRQSARQSLFPAPRFALDGWTDMALHTTPALDVEQQLREKFRLSRPRDAASGRSLEGVHRSDFLVRHAGHDMPADLCSTGEQKGLLVSIVLAHALMMQAEKGFVPLLLLDEVAAHLDDARRDELFAQLRGLDAQVWLTGTAAAVFAPLSDIACLHYVGGTPTQLPPRQGVLR